MDLNHCVKTTTHRQQTAIVGLILTLDHRDSEDGFVPRDGSREVLRDNRGVVACAVDVHAGGLAWGLLEPVMGVTCRD